jgi:hypothetical protein
VGLAVHLARRLLAVPLATGLAIGRVSLGLQAACAVGGLTLIVIYLFTDEPDGLAIAVVALGVVGTLALAAGGVKLATDEGDGPDLVQHTKEVHAMLAGIALPLFPVAAAVTFPLALGTGTGTVM